MSVDVATARTRVPAWSRIYGLGSVYAKTVRDSRLAFIIVAGILGGLMLVAGAGVGKALGTVEARNEIIKLVNELPPIIAGLSGKAINVATLGGYMTYKYGPFFAIIASLWSVLALSGTLAREATRGSLDFVAVTPFGMRRIALEKIAAHLTAMTGAMIILAFSAWLAGAAFATLPGDPIPVEAAIGFALWTGLVALAAGGLAFALAQVIGRAGAAGIAGAVVFAGYILNGYQASVPAFASIANLSWFSWTGQHNPLSGQYDWPSLIPVAVLAVATLAIGVEAFARRDIGKTSAIPTPSLPGSVLGLHGPVGRAFGERLPLSLGWGIGLGIFGLVIAASSKSLADALGQMSPQVLQVFRNILPSYDIASAGGFLQLVFVQIASIIVGFAAATFVSGWGSDEGSGRLELLLSTPLSRARWAIASGIGVYLAIAVMTLMFALAVGLGALMAGSDVATPMVGTVVLGLYAAALAGIGFAVGGLFRTSIAAEIVALIVTATFLIDLIAPALKLPDWVHQLALTGHLGQPMVGIWDVPGMLGCVVLAVGGLLLGGWGVRRRDVVR